MKVRTSARPFPFFLNLGFALFCLGGALWGAYDYWIAYPAIERAYLEHREATGVLAELGERVKARATEAASAPSVVTPPTISEEDIRRYEEAQATIQRIEAEFKGQPRQLAAWDRPLQLWLWVIGCGVLGLPFFVWPLYRMSTRRWQLDEDGTLRTPTAVIPLDQVTGIDMSRWCAPTGSKRSTWKAWLLTKDGVRHELDDHDYKDMHLIIGFYASRFDPETWKADAKRVKPLDDGATSSDGTDAPADEGDGAGSGSGSAAASNGSSGDD